MPNHKLTNEEWKAKLTDKEYHILREKGETNFIEKDS